MTEKMMGIGEFAAAVGLSASALRFYDRVGVLPPTEVDPHTGYRRYSSAQLGTGQLLARLRRIGMSVVDMAVLLDGATTSEEATRVLDAHVGRLEAGLADVRAEVERIRSLRGAGAPERDRQDVERDRQPDRPDRQHDGLVTVVELHSADLRQSLDSVRYALPAEPSDDAVDMVVVAVAPTTLTLSTTDRFRLASCSVPAALRAGEADTVFAMPAPQAYALMPALLDRGVVQLRISAGLLTVHSAGAVVGATVRATGTDPALVVSLVAAFDDVAWLTAHSAALLSKLDDEHLVPSLLDTEGEQVAFLDADPARPEAVTLVEPAAPTAVPVNARYLRESLARRPHGPVEVALRGSRPLAIRFGDHASTTAVVMPRRAHSDLPEA